MKKDEFKTWLMTVDHRSPAQTSDHISRVKRIEQAFSAADGCTIDVDNECKKDGCNSILDRLTFNSRKEMPADINLPTDRMGISRLKSSLRKYIEFYNWSEAHLNK